MLKKKKKSPLHSAIPTYSKAKGNVSPALGGGMCSGTVDAQNLAQTVPQMLIVGGELEGNFGTHEEIDGKR